MEVVMSAVKTPPGAGDQPAAPREVLTRILLSGVGVPEGLHFYPQGKAGDPPILAVSASTIEQAREWAALVGAQDRSTQQDGWVYFDHPLVVWCGWLVIILACQPVAEVDTLDVDARRAVAGLVGGAM